MEIDTASVVSHRGYMPRTIKEYNTRLAELRRSRDLSPTELAKRVPLGLPTLRKYESDERELGKKYAIPIAKALEIDVKELFAPFGAPIPAPRRLNGPVSKAVETNAEVFSKLSEEQVDQMLFKLWPKLHINVKLALMVIVVALSDDAPNRTRNTG